MLYKSLKKNIRFMSLLIMLCIIIPFVNACGGGGGSVDNNLTEHKENTKIGMGGDIDAYTTYATAPLKKMNKYLYYSYLMNYRSFILVVVPDENNFMFKSASQGVKRNIDGNDFKILMYYMLQSEFEDIEDAAEDETFVSETYNFIPSSTSNFSSSDIDDSTGYAERDFSCDTVVNKGRYLSNNSNSDREGDSVPVACSRDSNKNYSKSIFNVGNGIVLLYGKGALNGYIRDSDIRARIISSVNDVNYKEQFDMAISDRITQLNNFTRLDFASNSKFNSSYISDQNAYYALNYDSMKNAIFSREGFEGNSYVTLVTANGFIFDRGDIGLNDEGDFDGLMASLLEELIRYDACPNKALASEVINRLSPPKEGEEAPDVDFCEVYRKAINKFKTDGKSFSVPILSYNIEKNSNSEKVSFCNDVLDNGETCSTDDVVELYYYANIDKGSELNLDGLPYLGFYYEGKLVDHIYGASDYSFITEILSSWGVLK